MRVGLEHWELGWAATITVMVELPYPTYSVLDNPVVFH
jgi:hypothetical protein